MKFVEIFSFEWFHLVSFLLGVQVLCSRHTALVGLSRSSCAFIRVPGVSPAVEGANAALLLLRDPFVQ